MSNNRRISAAEHTAESVGRALDVICSDAPLICRKDHVPGGFVEPAYKVGAASFHLAQAAELLEHVVFRSDPARERARVRLLEELKDPTGEPSAAKAVEGSPHAERADHDGGAS